MSRDLDFTGWWEGNAVYSCDNCHKSEEFPFDSEDIDSRAHRAELRKKGWVFTKVDGEFRDFCGYDCRDSFIRKHTKN